VHRERKLRNWIKTGEWRERTNGKRNCEGKEE